jgi:hypothetical protein
MLSRLSDPRSYGLRKTCGASTFRARCQARIGESISWRQKIPAPSAAHNPKRSYWTTYDGRASKEEDFSEQTGVARPGERGRFIAVGDTPVSDVRYLEILELPDGRCRLYYEASLADGSHELRTEIVAPGHD